MSSSSVHLNGGQMPNSQAASAGTSARFADETFGAKETAVFEQHASIRAGRSCAATVASLMQPAMLDGMGIATSVGCLVHCAAMPIVAFVMPLLADELAISPLLHRCVMYSSVLLCCSALILSLRQRQRRVAGILCSSIGVALIATATIGPDLARRLNSNTAATNVAEVMRNAAASRSTVTDTPVRIAAAFNVLDGVGTPIGCLLLIAGRFVSRRRESDRCCPPVRSHSELALRGAQQPHDAATHHGHSESQRSSEPDREPIRIPRPHFHPAVRLSHPAAKPGVTSESAKNE